MIKEEYKKKGLCQTNHMVTYKGQLVDLLNFKPENVDIEVIAHGLARTARWNGQARVMYSVAQHSIYMFDKSETRILGLQCLLHDAEEAYWGDIIRPIKHHLPKDIRDAMDNCKQVIFDTLGVPMYDNRVNELDDEALQWEWDNVVHGSFSIEAPPDIITVNFLRLFNFHHQRYLKERI